MKKLLIFTSLLIAIFGLSVWGNHVKTTDYFMISGSVLDSNGHAEIFPESVRIKVNFNGFECTDAWYNTGDAQAKILNSELFFFDQYDDLDADSGNGQYYLRYEFIDSNSLYHKGDYWFTLGDQDVNVVSMDARTLDMTKFDTASVAAYYNFAIWLDDAASNTNSIVGVDGTPQNPVSTLAAARILADSMGLMKYCLMNNSSFTLDATYENWRFVGCTESNEINFGGQDIDNSHFEHLMVAGTQGGTGLIWLDECYLDAADSLECVARNSWFSDTISVRVADNIVFDNCYSAVAGNNTPGLDFNSGGGTINVNVRHYSGGLAVFNMTSNHTISYETDGQLIIDGSCTSANVTARGNMTITDNGTTTSLTDDAVFNKTELVDDTWDEILTGATHNIATSAGRRLRQLETGQVLLTGTINTANDSTATLDLGGAYDDDFFVHTWLVVTVGTDSVQIRSINGYTGATDSVDMAPSESWVVVPSNGDEWEIIANASVNVADLHQVVIDEIWEDSRPDSLLSPYRAGGFGGSFKISGLIGDSIRIENTNSHAVKFDATAIGAHGLFLEANGNLGFGLYSTAFGISSAAAKFESQAANGYGIHIMGTGSNAAIYAQATGDADGFKILGLGSGNGLCVEGGATGHGIDAVGGATSGHGISSTATNSGYGFYAKGKGNSFHGIRATGDGTGAHGILGDALGGGASSGIVGAGGSDGNGIYGAGGASGGAGAYFLSQATNGHGISAQGAGTGAGLYIVGGSSAGAGIEAVGGSGGIDVEGDLEGTVADGDSIMTQSDTTACQGAGASLTVADIVDSLIVTPLVIQDTVRTGDTLAVKKDSLVYQGSASGLSAAEVADTLTNRGMSTGGGTEAETLIVLNSADSTSIQDARPQVYTLDQSTPKAVTLTTDVNGKLIYFLGDGVGIDSFFVVTTATGFVQSTDTIVVASGGGTDTIFITAFDVGAPSSPDKCRLFIYTDGILGDTLEGATFRIVPLVLINRNWVADSNSIIIPTEQTATTDSTGLAKLDVWKSHKILSTKRGKTDSLKFNIEVFHDALPGKFKLFNFVVPDTSQLQITRTE